MRQFRSIATVLVVLVCSVPLAAQQRTFVSTSGLDTNDCLLNTPCRSFNAAVSAVAAGGEVVVKDSGGYGPFTITRGVSIVTPAGVYSGVTAFAGTAVIINVASGDPVMLRGLTVVGLGAVDGIVIADNAQTVLIDGVVVTGFSGSGLAGGDGQISIADSVFRNNAGNGAIFGTGSGLSRATFTRCRFENNGFAGINGFSSTRVLVRDSVAAYTGTGFLTQNGVALQFSSLTIEDSLMFGNEFGVSAFVAGDLGTALAYISRSTISENTNGIWVNGGSLVRVSDSVITTNENGLVFSGPGTILSRGDNSLVDNFVNGVFSGNFAPQ